MNKFRVVWKTRRRRLFFKIYIPNLTLRSIFNFEMVLTVRHKLYDFKVSSDSLAKDEVVLGVAVVKLPFIKVYNPHSAQDLIANHQ